MTVRSKEKIKLAIIGCGAVAQERYLPATELVPNIAVTHVVDLDVGRAKNAAAHFQIPSYVRDYRKVFGQVDAIVIATPPSSHARISIDCLNHGLPVLCEKPLATSVEEAKAMIAASQQTHTLLAVGMVRRLSESSQLLHKLIQIGILGDIHRFDAEEGHEFNWPLRTGHIFKSSETGGVLADTGTHLFDLLLWAFESRRMQLLIYRDDNWGGVEMNALVELAIEWQGKQIPGKIELSFTRRLRNTLIIYGQRGYLEAPALGGCEVLFYPHGKNSDPVILKSHNAKPRKSVEEFALQLSNFANAIMHKSEDYVTADEALPTISIIEQCRRSRRPMAQPWEMKHLESFFKARTNDE